MGYNVITSVGIEFESDYINRSRVRGTTSDFSTEHDASIESYAYDHRGQLFKNKLKQNDESVIVGCEFKSRVFAFDYKEDLYDNLCSLLSKLEEMGDSYKSDRSGIHVHICMPYNIHILKSSLRAAAHLEQVFFHLGGMGYENRGIHNNFSFCRPITKYGPSLVPMYDGNYCQCFNLDDLYSAKTVDEFFNRYGDINLQNPPGKYTPVRYHWITLYPLLTYGTIEYRIFNKTYNPLYLYTIIKFCQQVSNTCLTHKFPQLEENSIYSATSISSIINTMKNFIYKYELSLDEKDIMILEEIIKNTPLIKLDDKYCITHLQSSRSDLRRAFNDSYHPPYISTSNAITPKVVTIHNINRNTDPILG
jgi:hypothetical protein